MTSGVYKITNIITGELYIGSSKDIESRYASHRSLSAHKRHPNSKLYKDMSKYGRDNFTIEVIEETDNLKEREQYWIEYLKPSYNNNRAQGWDIERFRLYRRKYYEIHRDEQLAHSKAYRQIHRDECLARNKDWHKANRDEQLAKYKAYNNRLCLYNGETLTLNALALRLRKQGIASPYKEAKKYLL